MKRLTDILKNLEFECCGETDTEVEIKNITFDSREVEEGVLYCCLVGQQNNGHKYIDEVIQKGAAAVVFSDESYIRHQYEGVPFLKVKNTRKALSVLSANFWGNPSEKMKLLGVTGTNGKTSITHYIHEILNNEADPVGLIGTTGMQAGAEKINYKIKTSTTPDPMELHEIMSIMNTQYQVKNVAMEVTSHALELDKLESLYFDIAVFTNLTQDHLDYHKTMEQYLAAKLKLMSMCKLAVINSDSDAASAFVNACKGSVITYSVEKPSDFQALNVQCEFSHVEYDLVIDEKMHHIYVPIPGYFTVYNTLATLVCCIQMGMDIEEVKCRLKVLGGVPGRMQVIKNDLGINVIIDYAHTPDSLENILSTVQDFTKGDVITVVGCGGNRDRTKRPIMGSIAYDHSDYLILTSDNPRDEFPSHIIIEMLSGISEKMQKETSLAVRDHKKVVVQVNRNHAIQEALNHAKPGDSVVIAGKGHENYQELKNKVKLSFDDYAEADNYIKIIQNNKLQ